MFCLQGIGLQYFGSFVNYKLDWKNVRFSSSFLDLFTRKKNNLSQKTSSGYVFAMPVTTGAFGVVP